MIRFRRIHIFTCQPSIQMRYLISVLLIVLTISSCKKTDSAVTKTTATKIDVTSINSELKGTWVTSAKTTYYSASSTQMLVTDDFPRYDLSFDGQTSLNLIGKVATIPNFITKYNLTSDDKSAYISYTDQLAVAHTMQITTLTDTELDFNETIDYTQPVANPGGSFAYNKKITSYKCSKK